MKLAGSYAGRVWRRKSTVLGAVMAATLLVLCLQYGSSRLVDAGPPPAVSSYDQQQQQQQQPVSAAVVAAAAENSVHFVANHQGGGAGGSPTGYPHIGAGGGGGDSDDFCSRKIPTLAPVFPKIIEFEKTLAMNNNA